MASLQAKARALYRALHRELTLQVIGLFLNVADLEFKSQPAPHLTLNIPRNKIFHNYLREVFTTKQVNPERRIAEGNDVLLFLRSQRTYKTLLERYNPSVGIEQDEKVRRTARRVGLELPEDLKARIEESEEEEPSQGDTMKNVN